MSPRAGKRCLVLTATADLSSQATAEANPNTDTGTPRRLVKRGGVGRE